MSTSERSGSRQAEVTRHFENYSRGDRWGELYDPSNPLSHSFLARRRKAMELLGDLDGRKLLDMGCGSGPLIPSLAGSTVEYTGIDISAGMIAAAQHHIDELGIAKRFHVQVGSVDALPFAADSFDAVVGMGLLEYFDHPETVIAEALRVVKPGGPVVFTVPRRHSVNETLVGLTSPLRAIGREVTRKGREVDHSRFTDAEFKDLFVRQGGRVIGERLYNKVILPYPVPRFFPRVAQRAAQWAEDRDALAVFATGYIVAGTK